MTAMHLFHSTILAFGHMEEELSTACRAAANALEILNNLISGEKCYTSDELNDTLFSAKQRGSPGEQRETSVERKLDVASLKQFYSSSACDPLFDTRTELVGKALVEAQQGQSSFCYCLEILKDRGLSLPYTVQ